jgi:hypothetical protein
VTGTCICSDGSKVPVSVCGQTETCDSLCRQAHRSKDAGSSSSPLGRTLQKISGDGQTLARGQYGTFVVRVLDESGQPVVGALVAWREPAQDARTYVGMSDTSGQSSATQLNASSPGSFQETAALVDASSWSGGAGFASTFVPTTGPVVSFSFFQN